MWWTFSLQVCNAKFKAGHSVPVYPGGLELASREVVSSGLVATNSSPGRVVTYLP
jgi:hypothetical protein